MMAAQSLAPPTPRKKNTIGSWLPAARALLAPTSETASLDARVLLAHVLACTQAWLIAHPEYELSPREIETLNGALDRLTTGEPLPYVLGRWAFFGLDFQLNPQVLIPRPETELLVEKALAWLAAHPDRRLAADLGTGSGCIAVTLAKHTPDLRVLALDLSWEALRTARLNARKHEVLHQVDFIQSDLLDPFNSKFDLICANLPYIPTRTLPTLAVARREPTLALDGGLDGLALIRRLIASVPQALAPGGLLLLEIEAAQGPAVLALGQKLLPDASFKLWSDLAGLDRLVAVEISSH